MDGNFSKKFSPAMKHISHSVGMLINKNCCNFVSEHPQVIEEKPLYPENVTVLCALWSEGMIGLYFFEDDDGTTVTVNSERCGHMTFFVCY